MTRAEITNFWGRDNLARWSEASLREVAIPESFLIEVGMPLRADWTLRFDVQANQVARGPNGTHCVGFDDVVPICIDDRGQVMAVKEKEFVEAARALGASDLRVMGRHILPNILQPLIVQAAIGMAGAVLAEATLSFLGLGVPPPAASWGSMLNDARSHLFDSPHLVFFPAMAVMLCVLSFNFIGDALRDWMDPRTRMSAGL